MFDYTKNALLSFLAIPFLFVYIILSYGFVLTKLYGWFVFPIFPNFPQYIGILQMSGLMIFVEFLHPINFPNLKIGGEKIKSEVDFLQLIVGPWVTLLMGWILYRIIN